MGQKVLFDGKIYTEPVAKSRIVSGVSNTGAPSSFGNICIIDTGYGASFGGGVGAVGAGAVNRQLSEMVYQVNSASEMKALVKGGMIWDLADYLYTPSTSGNGASTVFIIRAAQTAIGTDSVTLAGGQTLAFETKEEGLIVNGTLDGSNLAKGYAWTLSAGVNDATKYIVKFWRGTYRGADADGYLYDGISQADAAAAPQLVAQSDEVSSIEQLKVWADGDADFTNLFKIGASTSASGNFASGDITSFSSYQVFAGGTESYTSSALDHVLDSIRELDCSIFLGLDCGADAGGANNVKILSHIVNDAEFKKFLIVGGSDDNAGFATSKAQAAILNSRYASLVHGGIEVPYILNKAIMIKKKALYKAAMYAGRVAGVEPQVPLTYKDLRIIKEQHQLTESQRVDAINSGIVATRFVPQLGNVVNQGVNTLQLNNFMINADGSSPELSIERIEAQLNRELNENVRVLFIGNNLSQADATAVTSFTVGYLQSKLAEVGVKDGLIIDFSNVKAVRQGTAWYVSYDFQANTPINKIFHTGTIIDPSI